MITTVRAKLAFAFGTICLIMAITIAVGLWCLDHVANKTRRVAEAEAQHHEIQNLLLRFQQLLMPANDYLIHGNPRERAVFDDLHRKTRAQLQRCRRVTRIKAWRTMLDQFETHLTQMVGQSQQILSLSNPRSDPRGSALMETMDAHVAESTVHLQVLLKSSRRAVRKDIATAETARRIGFWGVLLAGLVTLLSAVIAWKILSRHLSSRLARIADATRTFGEGSTLPDLPEDSRDEIGLLAHAFNSMMAALRESTVTRAYLDDLVQSLSEALVVVDEAGHIQTSNRAAATLTGRSLEALLDHPVEALFVNRAEATIFLKLARQRDQVTDYEASWVGPQGSSVPVLLGSTRIFSPQLQSHEIAIVAGNLTGVRLDEDMRLERANLDAVQDLVTTFRHQLNQPLMAGYLTLDEITAHLGDAERVRDSLEVLRQVLDQLRSRLDSLGRINKIERSPYSGDTKMLKLP